MQQIILITGASSGFGARAARAMARAGHTVYASMRDTQGRNAPQVDAVNTYVKEHGVDLRTVELDVQSQDSCRRGDRADRRRVEERGRWRQPDEGAGGAVRITLALRP
jgi:NAD(P)-dependent dehydrogenase (short-subunit alcohol dehydrogenase family)